MASDKTVVFITGANSGIGYETVLSIAKVSADYHVILGARSVKKGEKAKEEMRWTHRSELKGSISVLQIDVTDEASVAAAKEAIAAQFGKLDVLINNAGIIVYQDNVDTRTALRRSFETNTIGPMLLTEALEPLLKKAAKPYVVYVSTEQGSVTTRLDPAAEWAYIRGEPYRLSKAALNMAAACHRYNFAPWGCRVLALNPGFCVSNLTGAIGREVRLRMGAGSPTEPADAMRDIILGKRDDDIEKNGMIDYVGGVLPW
ncbi:putative short chain dehydrogenase/reductase [Xylariomycetidae sp. FL0641]|nr:putative short chain dehydrogenase/reductase [Xylariomycetidae sp. FL0641]